MTSLPTTVADATAEAERVIEECREAGDESRLLSCIAATATYDPGTRRVRTYGPLNAALAWAPGHSFRGIFTFNSLIPEPQDPAGAVRPRTGRGTAAPSPGPTWPSPSS